MNIITLLDPSICSLNQGDKIIMEAITPELQSLFPDDHFVHCPTHEYLGHNNRSLVAKSRYSFVCGTNLLSSNMNQFNQWKINLRDAWDRYHCILAGVGWWKYQEPPNLYTKLLLRRVLSREHIHSVRDGYTAEMLRCIGFDNVVNTGCPTMWNLSSQHIAAIPHKKATSVILTLSDHSMDPVQDRAILKLTIDNYERVMFWPQGAEDIDYISSFGDTHKITILAPTLAALDQALAAKNPLDYVGTRLHAGIRALQHGKRSIIIGIDNRALEMQKDFCLPVVLRGEHEELENMIIAPFETALTLPWDNLVKWKRQFLKS